MRDSAIQFDLVPPDELPQIPGWLRTLSEWIEWAFSPISRFFGWLDNVLPDAPLARMILIALLVALAAALLWTIVKRLREGRWPWPRRRFALGAEVPEGEHSPVVEAASARSWLGEADLLAAEGRYEEAVHHLLLRSAEDIARRHPALARPAVTSRELAAAECLPPAARHLFGNIARLVERSLFGGRPVSQAEWQGARSNYAEFILPRAWRT
ncbi:DUF4129 domain-containing protein [Altericroceibacterium xinjiangense]|uniref:DUF4129 domain-containing protein n=1 Tax=Altericroceibacterium xinjiangense TaxID=762261 RepID=UPI001F497043|nr:DUF4129 domain-containing protein [Altericroceibacterium xinjiangense]